MADGSPPASATHSLTLDRGLRALWLLRDAPDGLSASELAGALSTHRAAVYRMLAPLLEHHLVRRRADGRHLLGPGLIELAAAVQTHLQERAAPVLQELADELGATTALTLRDGAQAVVAAVVVPRDHLLHLTYRTGMRHDLTAGAPGHAIAAALPASPADTDDIRAARARGWARSQGQLLHGATGVAAVVRGPGGEPLAALSAVWISGIDERRAARATVAAADALTAALAGHGALSGGPGPATG